MSTATLTSEGQLTLPEDVRIALGVGPGDRVTFVRMADGNFAVLPATRSVMGLEGFLSRGASPVTLEEMDDALADDAGKP